MTLKEIDESRLRVSKSLEAKSKSALGQYFTPMPISAFMASWFEKFDKEIKLLDPGAGIGTLTSAVLDRINDLKVKPDDIRVTAYEIDSKLTPHLRKTLRSVGKLYKFDPAEFSYNIINSDFILDFADSAPIPYFTHAILNPPYKKISVDSPHRLALRSFGIETVNLYSGFLALVVKLMDKKGEIVAIIPRSFCNGTYFYPFRKFLLENVSIKRIHLFNSRTEAFNDDEVLQENIIIHLIKGVKQGKVIISSSTDSKFSDLSEFATHFDRVVLDGDKNKFIHIPGIDNHSLGSIKGINYTLSDIGLEISTGPVVDFRLTNYLKKDLVKEAVPLIYSNHFGVKGINFPIESKKPNAIMCNEETRKWLTPKGYYTVTKRFSSKEEKQRIVARVITPDDIPGDIFGIENHLNYFHRDKKPISEILAFGIAAYLNSSLVDQYFRLFSGHTQVNATDLRQLPYPSITVLERLGKWAIKIPSFEPSEIDSKVIELTDY